MAEGIQLESNAREIMERFRGLPSVVQLSVLKGIRRWELVTETKVLTGSQVKFSGSRSGLASRLTSYARKDSIADVDAAIGFRKTAHFPYELSQEFGATAKPGHAMVVPVSPQAKALAARGMGPRAMPGQMFIPRGRHVLASFNKGLGGIEVQYILIKSLKPRLGFRKTVLDGVPDLGNEIVEAWKQGWRAA
jgi:hypothetical protein